MFYGAEAQDATEALLSDCFEVSHDERIPTRPNPGVVDALYVALTLGVPLGYGTVDGSRRVSRVDAVDVALTVRRLVGRR